MAKKDEKIEYRLHPAAQQYPKGSPSEEATLEADVRLNGFRTKAVLWTDAEQNVWLIDGCTRLRIEERLHKAGVYETPKGPDGEPGKAIQLEFEMFDGTESDVIRFMESANLARRSLSASQRAAIGVLSYKTWLATVAGERGATTDEVEKDIPGEVAQNICNRCACDSKVYVYRCLQMHASGHVDLLERILGSDLKVQAATAIAARRKQGLKDEPEDGDEPEQPPVPTDGAKMMDGLNNELDEGFHTIFAVRQTVALQVKTLRKVLVELTDVAGKTGGRRFVLEELAEGIKGAVRHCLDHQPHAVCPICTGTGKNPHSSAKKCDQCKGRKFLDRLEWKTVPDDLRALWETNMPKKGKAKKGGDAEEE